MRRRCRLLCRDVAVCISMITCIEMFHPFTTLIPRRGLVTMRQSCLAKTWRPVRPLAAVQYRVETYIHGVS
jgi:hypothetical protein